MLDVEILVHVDLRAEMRKCVLLVQCAIPPRGISVSISISSILALTPTPVDKNKPWKRYYGV